MQCHVFDQRGEPEPLFGEQSAVTFAGFGEAILHDLTPPYKALPTREGQSTKNSNIFSPGPPTRKARWAQMH